MLKNKIRQLLILLISAFASVLLLTGYFNNKSEESKIINIVIGAILPLTGPVASDGNEALIGMQIAKNIINNNNINKKIEFIIRDGKYDSKESLVEFTNLVSTHHINGLIGFGDVPVHALVSRVNESKIPMIATTVGGQDFLGLSRWTFRAWLPAKQIASVMAEYASSVMHLTRISILSIDNVFGQESAKYFQEQFVKNNCSIVSKETFSLQSSNLRPQITKILQNDPDAVYVTGFGLGYITAVNQLRENGFNKPIITDSAINDPRVLPNVIKTHNIFYASTEINSSEKARNFINTYKAITKQNFPSLQALFGYIAVDIFYDSAKNSAKLSPEDIRTMIISKEHDTIIGKIQFSQQGEIRVPIIINTFNSDGIPITVNNTLWRTKY
jgi:branched-chain amino acid transport system substrate-binding protein